MSEMFLHIVERRDAIRFNLLKYFTGRPCKFGHIAQRYTSSFACIECHSIKVITHADVKREYDRKYREENKDKRAQQETEWKARNPDKVRAIKRAWKQRNPEYIIADAQNRRCMSRAAEGKFSASDIAVLLDRQKFRCAECTKKLKKSGKNRYHVDHIIPLIKGGSNWPHNLQILCPDCNLRKHAKHPIDFAQENGRLL